MLIASIKTRLISLTLAGVGTCLLISLAYVYKKKKTDQTYNFGYWCLEVIDGFDIRLNDYGIILYHLEKIQYNCATAVALAIYRSSENTTLNMLYILCMILAI